MTVYVDEITDYGDVARRRGLRSTQWAHLTADTPEELHDFAARLGLKRAWFQNADNYRWHYDVTPSKRAAALRAAALRAAALRAAALRAAALRAAALRAGAREIDRRGLAALMAARRAAGSTAGVVTGSGTVTAVDVCTTDQGEPWAVAAVKGTLGTVACHVPAALYQQCAALLVVGAPVAFSGCMDDRPTPPVFVAVEITATASTPPAAPSAPASAEPAKASPDVVPLAAPIFGNANGWADVMRRAGERCQCAGQCGSTHRKTGGRCDARHGGCGGKRCPPIRLEVAPEDPTVPEHAAARMTPDQLMAWCGKCRAGAVSKSKPAARGKKAPPPQSDALFGAELLG